MFSFLIIVIVKSLFPIVRNI